MRLIIAGSRDLQNYPLLVQCVERALEEWGITVDMIDAVISGKARGADTLGEVWAKENGIPVESKPADWQKHGRAAGPIRNEEMAKEAVPDGLCVIVRKNMSKGSTSMANLAKRYNLRARVFDI